MDLIMTIDWLQVTCPDLLKAEKKSITLVLGL